MIDGLLSSIALGFIFLPIDPVAWDSFGVPNTPRITFNSLLLVPLNEELAILIISLSIWRYDPTGNWFRVAIPQRGESVTAIVFPSEIGTWRNNLSLSYVGIPLVPKFSVTLSEAALFESKPWGTKYEADDKVSDVLTVNVVTPTFSFTTKTPNLLLLVSLNSTLDPAVKPCAKELVKVVIPNTGPATEVTWTDGPKFNRYCPEWISVSPAVIAIETWFLEGIEAIL